MTKAMTPAQKAAKAAARAAAADKNSSATPAAKVAQTPMGVGRQPVQGRSKPKSAGERLLEKLPHSGDVVVGCRMPTGLVLQLFQKVGVPMPVAGGGVRTEEIHQPTGERVKLNGFAVPFGATPNFPILGHYGMTTVDASFFRRYVEQNLEADIFTNGVVFAVGTEADAKAMASDLEGHAKSGLEPLNPDDDYRAPKRKNKNVTDITKMADEKAA